MFHDALVSFAERWDIYMVKQKPKIIYENTVPGNFVRRINRFTAEVLIDGKPEMVHVKNTGRLQELLVPDAKVTLQKTLNPNRKTAYDLISVYKSELKWVNIDSLAPNALMKQQLISMNYDLVIYALSDFLIMILSWLVKQSLRVFLFQEVQP